MWKDIDVEGTAKWLGQAHMVVYASSNRYSKRSRDQPNDSLFRLGEFREKWLGNRDTRSRKSEMYKLNLKNPIVKKFIELDNAICDHYASQLEEQEATSGPQENKSDITTIKPSAISISKLSSIAPSPFASPWLPAPSPFVSAQLPPAP